MIAVSVTGCSARDGSVAPAATATSATTPATSQPPVVRIDWSAPEQALVPGGWSLTHCPGDAPLICVAHNGQAVGQLEMLSFDIAALPDFAAILGSQGEAAALDDHARRFVADFTKDRAQGCGGAYTVTAAPIGRLATSDGPVLRYGFTGTLAGGQPSEAVLHYAGVRSRRLVLLVGTASDPGGCLYDGEGTVFTSSRLEAFRPVLDQLVVAGGLPRPPA
jgi:hypothetical protein